MIDDSFHLTPLDVRRMDFAKKSFGGYDPAKVDEFRNQVADELDRLTRLNQELDAKAKGFHEQLRAFRERDKALNEALVSAQQLRSEMREQTDREAQLVLREARAEGDRLIEEARAEVRRLQADIASLEKSRIGFIGQIRALVERQLAELAAMESASASSGVGPRNDGAPASAPAEFHERRAVPRTPPWLESLVKE